MWVEAADAPRERRSPLRAAPAALLDPTLDPTNPGSRLHPSNPESAAAAAARLGLPSSWRFGQPPSGSAAASTRHVSGRSDLAGLNLEPTAAEIVESIMERAVSGRETHLEQGNGRQLPWGPASPESSPPPPSYSPPPPLPRSPPPRSPPPRSPSHPTSKTESSSASESWGAVASFVDGAAVFAVSRMWSDLVGAFLFELHPLPFCGDSFLRRPCAPDAPSRAQFLYAVALVPLAGLGKHLAESRFAHVPGIGLLPTMIGYVVGWAFANAFQQGLVEIARDNPGLCDGASGCLGLNTAYSVLVTMVAALLMLVLHPYTQSVECGDSALVDWLEVRAAARGDVARRCPGREPLSVCVAANSTPIATTHVRRIGSRISGSSWCVGYPPPAWCCGTTPATSSHTSVSLRRRRLLKQICSCASPS